MIMGRDQQSAVLLNRAQQGDDAAFGALYRQVAPLARRAAYRIVGDVHAADDLVQETFYLVLRAVRAGQGPQESFVGYTLSTVKRLAYRHSRTHGRTVVVDDPDVWEQQLTGTPVAAHATEHMGVAWESLPPRWRNVLWLIEVDRYSPAELAAGTSMTPNAISSLASRARQALRSAYLSERQSA